MRLPVFTIWQLPTVALAAWALSCSGATTSASTSESPAPPVAANGTPASMTDTPASADAPTNRPPTGVARAAAATAGPAADARAPASARAGEPASDRASGPRLTSKEYKTWIWPKPKRAGRFLGYMRVGQSVALRSEELVRGEGCRRGFFQIEPRGYVCNDRTVTLNDDTPFLRANAHTAPTAGAFPYRYAISNGAPMYTRLPSAREQKRNEWQYGKAGEFLRLPLFQRGHEHLATTDPIAPVDPVPPFLAAGLGAHGAPLTVFRRSIPHGSMLAFTRAFDVDGRTFMLSADLTVVPADRVRQFRPSRFRGVVLGARVQLPIAWFRTKARPQYAADESGKLRSTGANWPLRSFVALTGNSREQDGRSYLEVDRGTGKQLFAAAEDATVVRHYGKLPFGVKPGDKWMLVSITAGTLVAYEDMKPVFTTLISPGQGGLPRKGGDLVKDSTTPLGAYRITFKDRAATMSPEFGEDRKFWIADVPFTQYFSPPFALHGAYWHEKFGEFMSGGCVNASPIDSEWLFEWSDPQVPAGWQGATGNTKENGGSSVVVIKR